MQRGALLLAFLVVAAPFAGCLGGGEAPATKETPTGGDDAPVLADEVPLATSDAPAWALGDAWTVRSMGQEQAEESTLVVTAVSGDSYTLSTTSEGTAGYDALNDVSYLGRIRASDLAGSQQGQPVQFFSFPLADGKTWQTTWDGLPVTLTARWSPAMRTSAGIHPGFAIEGVTEDGPYVKYDYVPMLRWWSHLSFASGFGFQVERVQGNWTGAYLAAEVKTLAESGTSAPLASPNALPFTVDAEQSFVVLTLRGASTAFLRAFAVLDPAGQPYPIASSIAELAFGPLEVEERLPPTPGEWRVAAPLVHHPDGAFKLTVQQVKLTPVAFP